VVSSYKELQVWQKGIKLVTEVYKVTDGFPRKETYSLTDQMRRAAVSVPSNIAEGFGRNTRPEMGRYSQFAIGSLCELETQIVIAKNLSYLSEDTFVALSESVSELERMLRSFSFSLRHPKSSKSKN